MFCCVSQCLAAFGTISLLHETRSKTGRTDAINANVHATKSHQIFLTNAPDPPHWTLNRCFGVFRTIWVHSGPFGCLTKLGAKRAELVQKFMPRSRVGIFHIELCRSTPLDCKLTFWCVSYYLDAFGTVWLAYKTRCKTCRTGAKVCARKSRRIFSQRTLSIHPISP